jgi:hypothetical protein
MPTLVGLRRRGYTPESIRVMCERAGTSKAGGWTDYASLEIALRDDLESKAARAMAVLEPIRLTLANWAEVFGSAAHREPCRAPVHPQRPELGMREFSLGPELWIERDDFAEVPAKGFFRLYPGNRVRLKYGYVVECTGCEKDASGVVTRVLATVVPDTRSGTPGADAVKVKGTLTWLAVDDALPAEMRLYDRLFNEPHPDAGGKDFKASLHPDSKKVVAGYVERALATAQRGERFQFERHGYFVADLVTTIRRRSSTAQALRDTCRADERAANSSAFSQNGAMTQAKTPALAAPSPAAPHDRRPRLDSPRSRPAPRRRPRPDPACRCAKAREPTAPTRSRCTIAARSSTAAVRSP